MTGAVVCAECGKNTYGLMPPGKHGSPRQQVCCHRVHRAPGSKLETVRADARIDWLAIELVVVDRRRIALNTAERDIAVRRLAERVPARHSNHNDIPPGMVTVAQVGELIGVTERHAQRIKAELPPATRHRCPVCCGPMWVLDRNGVVEEHGDGNIDRCPMSGRLAVNRVALLPVPQAVFVLRCYALAVSA